VVVSSGRFSDLNQFPLISGREIFAPVQRTAQGIGLSPQGKPDEFFSLDKAKPS
jgi:hypothetical protein